MYETATACGTCLSAAPTLPTRPSPGRTTGKQPGGLTGAIASSALASRGGGSSGGSGSGTGRGVGVHQPAPADGRAAARNLTMGGLTARRLLIALSGGGVRKPATWWGCSPARPVGRVTWPGTSAARSGLHGAVIPLAFGLPLASARGEGWILPHLSHSAVHLHRHCNSSLRTRSVSAARSTDAVP